LELHITGVHMTFLYLTILTFNNWHKTEVEWRCNICRSFFFKPIIHPKSPPGPDFGNHYFRILLPEFCSNNLIHMSPVVDGLPLVSYLLTPWSRVLLEKLTVNFAASQEIPRVYGTRKFLTVPTSARHLSLSWANSIQSPRTPPTFWRSILILSSHLRLGLPNGLFPVSNIE
jgi:hypothetical protein